MCKPEVSGNSPCPPSEGFKIENIRGTNVWLQTVNEIKEDVWIFDYERAYSNCRMRFGKLSL